MLRANLVPSHATQHALDRTRAHRDAWDREGGNTTQVANGGNGREARRFESGTMHSQHWRTALRALSCAECHYITERQMGRLRRIIGSALGNDRTQTRRCGAAHVRMGDIPFGSGAVKCGEIHVQTREAEYYGYHIPEDAWDSLEGTAAMIAATTWPVLGSSLQPWVEVAIDPPSNDGRSCYATVLCTWCFVFAFSRGRSSCKELSYFRNSWTTPRRMGRLPCSCVCLGSLEFNCA